VPPPSRDVTELLRAWSHGDPLALEALVPIVYSELRQLADRHMRGQVPGHTLHATALVHEAYLKLSGQQVDLSSRGDFFRVASTVMRTVLVDHARTRNRAKRGAGAIAVTLGAESDAAHASPEVDVVELDEALTRLATFDPERSRLVELRYFTGLTIEETAEVLGVSPAKVKRDWVAARAWLRRELSAA
jgi:RNA polymerase sigma factor (TIGR02999 family)